MTGRPHEHWYEIEYREIVRGRPAERPTFVERDDNHGFCTGNGTAREKALAWLRDCALDWCWRTRRPPGRWDVRLWRLDDDGRRVRLMASDHVRWPGE